MKIACTDNGTYRTDRKSWTNKLVSHSISYIEPAMSKLPEDDAQFHSIITYALSQGLKFNLHAPYGVNNIASTDSELRASSIANAKQVYIAIENKERRPYELVYTVQDLNRFEVFTENNPYFGVTVDFAHYASHGIGFPAVGGFRV